MAQCPKTDKSDHSVADILARTNTLAPFIWRRAHVTRLDIDLILHLILATFEKIIGQDLPDHKQDEDLKLEDLKDLDQGQEPLTKNVVRTKSGGGDAYKEKRAPKPNKNAYEKKNIAFVRTRVPSTSTFRKRIISTKVRKMSSSGAPSSLSDLLSPLITREPSRHPRPTTRRPSVTKLTARASRASRCIPRDPKSIVGVAAKLSTTPELKMRPKSRRPNARRFSQNTNESYEYKGSVSPETSYLCRSLRASECLDHLKTRLKEIRHRQELMTNEEKHIVNAMKSMLEDVPVKDKKKPKTISSYRIPKR
ncbi:hypothetical protein CHS0354_006493 [Potamilus streckersoni]|uniref:Uncharacterized protein n=1 Tax=Potamilus streckersoni TaxID=2493646 RepID=A0AAE0RLY6_9BIVA|nr:hypothetical protein CHS0354_006493 [Potamilus streckersoni]